MFKLSKSEYFNLLFCIYHVIYKRLEKFSYDQTRLNLYTYKILKTYKYNENNKKNLNLHTYKIASYKYDKSGLK